MPKPRRLKFAELKKRLKPYGLEVITKRGKGSERMLYQKSTKFNFPIKYHGKNEEYSIGTLMAILRRFSLPKEALWD